MNNVLNLGIFFSVLVLIVQTERAHPHIKKKNYLYSIYVKLK
jgi:hypothetical protein